MLLFARGLADTLLYKVDLDMQMDASSAIAIGSRQGVGRIKHLNLKMLWLQRRVESKEITLTKINRDLNTADLGTKYVKEDFLRWAAEQIAWYAWKPGDQPKDRSSSSHANTIFNIFTMVMAVPSKERQRVMKLLTTAALLTSSR